MDRAGDRSVRRVRVRADMRCNDRKGICGYCKELCHWDGSGTDCPK